MEKTINLLFRSLALCAMFGFALAVNAQDIRWGGVVNPGGGSERENILHAPDHRYTAIDPPLTVSHFTPSPGPGRGVLNTAAGVYPTTMHYTGLAGLLGISDKMLARADVIAFEGNGGYGPSTTVGWESSDWTFSAGTNTRRVSFHTLADGSPRPGGDATVIATGTITSTAYS